jgi:hypothetical protein
VANLTEVQREISAEPHRHDYRREHDRKSARHCDLISPAAGAV